MASDTRITPERRAELRRYMDEVGGPMAGDYARALLDALDVVEAERDRLQADLAAERAYHATLEQAVRDREADCQAEREARHRMGRRLAQVTSLLLEAFREVVHQPGWDTEWWAGEWVPAVDDALGPHTVRSAERLARGELLKNLGTGKDRQ